MRRTSFTMKLFLRSDKVRSNGEVPVYVRLRLASKKMELSTNQYVLPKQWDGKQQKVVKHHNTNTLNQYLSSFISKLNAAYSQLFIANEEVTLEGIRQLVFGEAVKKKSTLIAVAEEHNQHFESMLGIKYSQGSYKNYKSTLKYLMEFVPIYAKAKDIELGKVGYKFCEAFYSFLTTTKNCRVNGANKQIQRLKKIMNYAIKHGYIERNPMATFSISFEPVNKVGLTLEEVRRIMSLELKGSTISGVRDVFLLQCFTGISYADVKRLSSEHISKGNDGLWWIKMTRQKTQVAFTIPILQPALLILQSYINQSPKGAPFMPVISNQKMNQNLKLIRELAGIDKNLTTHLGRHTFATTITLNMGVPIDTVSKLLGHTKLSTTQQYAKVLESKIAQDLSGLNDRLSRSDII